MAHVTTSAGRCSACYGSKPGVPHVDFRATYDGPVLTDLAGGMQFIAELVICEPCLKEAFRTLELSVNPIGEVERERDQARAETDAWKAYAEGLEEAHAQRPEPIRRGRGRPPRRAERPELLEPAA